MHQFRPIWLKNLHYCAKRLLDHMKASLVVTNPLPGAALIQTPLRLLKAVVLFLLVFKNFFNPFPKPPSPRVAKC